MKEEKLAQKKTSWRLKVDPGVLCIVFPPEEGATACTCFRELRFYPPFLKNVREGLGWELKS